MLLKLGFLGLGDGRQCILLDRALQTNAHAGHGSRVLHYEHWLHSTLLIVTVPLRVLTILHVVHDLAKCGTIVEVNLYQLAFLMVVNERFVMLTNIQLGIVWVRNVGEKLPNGGLCPTALLQQRSNILFFDVMVVAIAEPINSGPWGTIAMLATCIIVVQKFGVIGDERVAQGI